MPDSVGDSVGSLGESREAMRFAASSVRSRLAVRSSGPAIRTNLASVVSLGLHVVLSPATQGGCVRLVLSQEALVFGLSQRV